MFLAIDIGNTNITFGLLKGYEMVAEARVSSTTRRTADELRWLMASFLVDHDASDSIKHVGIASVVLDVTAAMERAVKKHLPDIPCDVIGVTVLPNIPISYQPPSAVGIDRLCNVVAGVARWGAPLIVIDFGTATTVDAVDSDGVYVGGAIAPGIETAMHSLASRTSQLFNVQLQLPEQVIGRNTSDAIRSGLLWGSLGAADNLAIRFALEIGGEPHVIATGGFAPLLAPHSSIISEVAPYLVLEGIKRICESAL
ncbi:MAG: type III pantothenate kinase [bacterium]|nr:type III pantothenate kinase [bacterium]